MSCARNGPEMVDFVRNTAGALILVVNGLGMTFFVWKKTAEMILLVENGPEMTCFLKKSLENDGPGMSLTLWLASVVGFCTCFCCVSTWVCSYVVEC